jgi:hypothetical protein
MYDRNFYYLSPRNPDTFWYVCKFYIINRKSFAGKITPTNKNVQQQTESKCVLYTALIVYGIKCSCRQM